MQSTLFHEEGKDQLGFKFSLVNEIQELATDGIYALTRKFGQHRFTIEKAIRKVPKLRKYVTAAKRQAISRHGPGRPPKVFGSEPMANAGLSGVLAALLQEIARQGGLRVKVNLIVHLKKSGGYAEGVQQSG